MKTLLALVAALVIATPAHAQPRVYSQAELDSMLAPIALQPDGLVSQVLIAATYPDEVRIAASWSRANPHLRGEDAVRAVQGEPWDPAVKALVAFPELLARMDESPQWLDDLGQAFLSQQAQVMDTVQGLRRRAQAQGNLATTDQYTVYGYGDAIVVEPRAQIVYVRYYDPYVVYGPWWWGPYYYPVVWRPWAPRPVFVSYGFFYTRPVWHQHYVRVVHRPAYVQPHTHVTHGRWQHRPVETRPPQQRWNDNRPMSHRPPQNRPPENRPPQREFPRAHPGPQPHVRVPESQRRPIVQSASPVVPHQQMPAANGYSHPRREATPPQHREAPRVQPREMPRAHGREMPRAHPRETQRAHPRGEAKGHRG